MGPETLVLGGRFKVLRHIGGGGMSEVYLAVQISLGRQVALKVLRVVGSRLRRLVGIIEELSFTTVRHRLASFLLRLAQKEGRQAPDGLEVMLPVSNQELASQIGTVRELVSRNLSRLQAEGLLKIDGRSITIRNIKALEAELQGST